MIRASALEKLCAIVGVTHISFSPGNMLVSGATDIEQNNHTPGACYGAISPLGMLSLANSPKGRVSANTPLLLVPCVGVASIDIQCRPVQRKSGTECSMRRT